MCDKAILENGGTLKCVPDCYKNQELCKKTFDSYPPALGFSSKCYKTKIMCDNAVNTYLSTTKFVRECFMTQKMCNKAVNSYFFYLVLFLINIKLKKCVLELFLMILFLIVYRPNKYITPKMCYEAVMIL